MVSFTDLIPPQINKESEVFSGLLAKGGLISDVKSAISLFEILVKIVAPGASRCIKHRVAGGDKRQSRNLLSSLSMHVC